MNKRFPLRFGPAFLIALALSGLLLWYKHVSDQRPRGPVIVEHQTPPSSSGTVGVPDPSFVEKHAAELGLSKKQAEQVTQEAARWEKEAGDLQRRLDAAGAALQARLQHAGKLTPSEMHDLSGDLQALSAEMSRLRQAYWPRLQAILTPAQQQRAQQVWADAHRMRAPAPK